MNIHERGQAHKKAKYMGSSSSTKKEPQIKIYVTSPILSKSMIELPFSKLGKQSTISLSPAIDGTTMSAQSIPRRKL
ncbi:MAG: hypothetical protein ACTSVZ_03710 [Promethearchaeota archaeon]